MIWRKYHLYYLLSLVVLLSTFCFGVNKVSAYDLYTGTFTSPTIYFVSNSLTTNGRMVFGTTTPNLIENQLYDTNSGSGNEGCIYTWSSNAFNFTDYLSPVYLSACDNVALNSPVYYLYFFQNSNGFTAQNILGYDVLINGSNTNIPTSITSFTYSTTTQTARVQGYWNATTTPDVTERLEFHQFSTMLGIESFKQVVATTTGLFDYSFNYKVLPTPATGTTTPAFTATTTLFARIYQYDNNYATDLFSGQFDSRYKTLLVATTTTITATTTDISTLLTGRDVFAYPEYECGITSLTGCIKNALIWSFYPTQDSIEQYNDFISLLQTKAPIGYFYTAKDSLTGLSATSTSNVFDIDIPYSLKRYIFTPLDVAIAGILWFFFLINFYKRFKTIQL
jgi:hypothetical protein